MTNGILDKDITNSKVWLASNCDLSGYDHINKKIGYNPYIDYEIYFKRADESNKNFVEIPSSGLYELWHKNPKNKWELLKQYHKLDLIEYYNSPGLNEHYGREKIFTAVHMYAEKWMRTEFKEFIWPIIVQWRSDDWKSGFIGLYDFEHDTLADISDIYKADSITSEVEMIGCITFPWYRKMMTCIISAI